MLQEYLKLTEIVSNFDASLITVKSWGVTLGLVAIGLGFKEKTWGYFLLAAICGTSFWAIEFTLKGHQMRYFPRMREIEYQMAASGAPDAPRIDWSWTHADKIFQGDEKPLDVLFGAANFDGGVFELEVVSEDVSTPHHVATHFYGSLGILIGVAGLPKEGKVREIWSLVARSLTMRCSQPLAGVRPRFP